MVNNIGINDGKLKKTILECYDVQERLQNLLNEAENIVFNLKDSFLGDDVNCFYQNFQEFSTNFAIAVSNVEMYGNDLSKVRKNFIHLADETAKNINYNER